MVAPVVLTCRRSRRARRMMPRPPNRWVVRLADGVRALPRPNGRPRADSPAVTAVTTRTTGRCLHSRSGQNRGGIEVRPRGLEGIVMTLRRAWAGSTEAPLEMQLTGTGRPSCAPLRDRSEACTLTRDHRVRVVQDRAAISRR